MNNSEAAQRMMSVYRADGVPNSFLQRAIDTPASEMWYPTRDELIAANVLTTEPAGHVTDSDAIWVCVDDAGRKKFVTHIYGGPGCRRIDGLAGPDAAREKPQQLKFSDGTPFVDPDEQHQARGKPDPAWDKLFGKSETPGAAAK